MNQQWGKVKEYYAKLSEFEKEHIKLVGRETPLSLSETNRMFDLANTEIRRLRGEYDVRRGSGMRNLVQALVILIVIVAGVLAAIGFTERTIFASVYATLSVAALVGALVVLKLYEVFKE